MNFAETLLFYAVIGLAVAAGLALVFLAAAALAGATTLRGTVRDSVTGKPVPRARVELLEAPGTLVVTTDDAGSFATEVRETGPVTLAVSHPGYQVARMALATLPERSLAVALDPIISIADGIEVTATRAREGMDPVTFTNIPQEHVIGHRDAGLMAGFDWRRGQYKTCPGRLFDTDAFQKRLPPFTRSVAGGATGPVGTESAGGSS